MNKVYSICACISLPAVALLAVVMYAFRYFAARFSSAGRNVSKTSSGHVYTLLPADVTEAMGINTHDHLTAPVPGFVMPDADYAYAGYLRPAETASGYAGVCRSRYESDVPLWDISPGAGYYSYESDKGSVIAGSTANGDIFLLPYS